MSWGRRLRHMQRQYWASGNPLFPSIYPQNQSLPTLLFYALTYTSDFMGGCSPTTSLGEGVNLQLLLLLLLTLQSCPTLCNPIDGSPPGSTVPGILQARTLEWVAISSSNITFAFTLTLPSTNVTFIPITSLTTICYVILSFEYI